MIDEERFKAGMRFRVLATHWESECYTECWCDDAISAQTIARAIGRAHDDASVQIDKVELEVLEVIPPEEEKS